MWAETTLRDRQNLWRRFDAWTVARGLPTNADSASLFVLATQVRPQGLLSYAKALSAVFGHMGRDNHPLRALASALRAAGAAIPCAQAEPIPRELLLRWARAQESSVCLAALVAWKTASRWGEVCALSSPQFLLVTPQEVIIDWFRTPKARKRDPFRPSRFAVVQGDLTSEIATLFQECSPFEKLTEMTTEALDVTWKRAPAMSTFSAHSIKRGAATFIFQKLASGEAVVPAALVDRLTKHEEKEGGGADKFSDTTLRYGGDLVALARALRTGEVTRHL
ncbi:hypothetical protein DIPPA_25585 [Diplonema papillatum]|nr:hypothetical protein DIPPA_26367 [Diplonema papillatum]KAJ9459717.1 hypothetical protein DIPPA_33725 [Diplonema papillatum]KAJ9462534.1 hypothetical protein DIPPA_25585 [Diplonema papillatum]